MPRRHLPHAIPLTKCTPVRVRVPVQCTYDRSLSGFYIQQYYLYTAAEYSVFKFLKSQVVEWSYIVYHPCRNLWARMTLQKTGHSPYRSKPPGRKIYVLYTTSNVQTYIPVYTWYLVYISKNYTTYLVHDISYSHNCNTILRTRT